MINIQDDYWSRQFDITQDDLNRVAERLERTGAPQDLIAIALPVIKGRIEHGHDFSPAVLSELTGKPSVRLWDPACEWQVGDVVLVAHDRSGNLKHEAFLGEIIFLDQELADIKIEELQSIKTYTRTLPGTKNAKKHGSAIETWRKTLRDSVENKLQSGNLNEQIEGVLLKHGERILSRLAETLQTDSRFSGLDGKWYLTNKLPRIEAEALKRVHLALLQNPSYSETEILTLAHDDTTTDATQLRMALHAALQKSPQRFENTGTVARPQWKARLPEPGQAEVAYFAYDPQTYEILCRPGQRLTQKKAQRLQELNLYAHVVTFAE
jgi:hypothetical protein